MTEYKFHLEATTIIHIAIARDLAFSNALHPLIVHFGEGEWGRRPGQFPSCVASSHRSVHIMLHVRVCIVLISMIVIWGTITEWLSTSYSFKHEYNLGCSIM